MIWGEEVPEEVNAKNEFLMGQLTMPECHTGQAKSKVFSGVEWMVRELVKDCTHSAVELASLTEGAAKWGEWERTERE